MMWYWGGGLHWWGWLLGLVGMIAFWGLIVWAIWYFVTGMTTRRPPEPPRQEPGGAKRILDERLARGEIDVEEYRRLLGFIRGDHGPGGDGRPPVEVGGQRRPPGGAGLG